MSSTAAHAAVLALVLLAGGWAARKAVPTEVPFLEIIPTDLKLTMGDQIGGGTPNPRPLDRVEGMPALPKVTTPDSVVAPVPPKVETKPIEPLPEPKKVEKQEKVEKVEAAKSEPVKTERKIEVSKEVRPTAKAQDVDDTKKADKPKIQVSKQVRTLSSADKQKAEREAREAREAQEAREAAASAAQARAQRSANAQKLASRLTGAAVGVSQKVGGSTQIEMPGPGGAAYAPYTSWLQTFLYQQWRRPTSSSSNQEWVGLNLTISKDGTVLGVSITRSSGIRSLDASVEEIFRRHPKLRPLPDEYQEPRLVVPVKFVLEAPGSL
ncbi:MAG: TonB family protein [Verrucomicrobia bacterium]|nr:TonB family protein [Verrucomicrobiota bacterium]